MERTLPVPADQAFALLADLHGHGRWIPWTRMDAPAREPRVGDEILALSAGVLPDRMRVERVEAPRVLELRKLGPLLLGTARIEVRALSPHFCRVRWTESVHLSGPLPAALTRPLMGALLEAMVALALARVDRHVSGTYGPRRAGRTRRTAPRRARPRR